MTLFPAVLLCIFWRCMNCIDCMQLINKQIDMSVKEDLLYFLSIPAAYITIMFTDHQEIHQLFDLPVDSLQFYALMFSVFLIFSCLLTRWLGSSQSEQEKAAVSNNLSLLNSEEHLVLALIIGSALSYAHSVNPELCNFQKMSHIVIWFLISRYSNVLGVFMNKATRSNTWTTFGNAMAMFIVAISFGLAAGFDSFLLL